VDVPEKKVRPEGGVHVGGYLAEGLINSLDHEIVDQGERLLRQPRIKEKNDKKGSRPVRWFQAVDKALP
jgi:hypothetical protein